MRPDDRLRNIRDDVERKPAYRCAHAGYDFIYALRTDLLGAQVQVHAATCDKSTRRAITKNLSSPSHKNIPLNMQGKSSA
jgi:hypothetical protein